MKTRNIILSTFAIVAAVLANAALLSTATTGCALTSSSGSGTNAVTTINTNNLAVETASVSLAAEVAVASDLQSRPGDLVYFQAAQQVLETYATGTNAVSVSTIEGILQETGNDSEATNPVVIAAISGVLTIADDYLEQNSSSLNSSQQSQIAQAFAGAIATGIGNAEPLAVRTSIRFAPKK